MLSLKNIIREILLDILSLFGNIFFLLAKKPKIETTKIKKILIVKLYALGDCVYAQPMVPNLKANFPNAKIYWLVQKYSRTIIEHIEGVDQIIEWQGIRTYRQLRQENIDLAFSLYRSPLSFIMLWLARIPIRVGFGWRGRGFALTHKIKFRADVIESDRYLKLIEDLGFPTKTRDRRLVVGNKEKEEVKDKAAKFGLDFHKRPIVGIFPGGGDNPQLLMPMKRWDPERFAKVADWIVKEKKAQVVLLGGPSEKELGQKLESTCSSPLLNLIGQTELTDLVAFLSLLDLLIACDTGPLHIAGALDVKTVGLFGPSDPKILTRESPTNIVIRKEKSDPIYLPGTVFWRSFRGTNEDQIHPSMLAIQANDVIKATEKLL